MRVLVAGASGAIGRALVPALLARGHQVAGLVRTEASSVWVADQGAVPFFADEPGKGTRSDPTPACRDRPRCIALQGSR
jgi:nucleoside-diphosphate-sugar epimerase